MSGGPFAPSAAELPSALPIFPLTGVLLLPRGRLPLNVFEPRYLEMTRDALGAPQRLIGMIQPQEGAGDAGAPEVYRVGCAGRICEFAETDDGRYLITLAGVSRFAVAEELPRERLYRRVVPQWAAFAGDLEATAGTIERKRLLQALKPFLARHGIAADWPAIEAIADEHLVTTAAMIAPLAPAEKQALLEARDLKARASLLTALLEMAVAGQAAPGPGARH
jgi:Lon protease-like protein